MPGTSRASLWLFRQRQSRPARPSFFSPLPLRRSRSPISLSPGFQGAPSRMRQARLRASQCLCCPRLYRRLSSRRPEAILRSSAPWHQYSSSSSSASPHGSALFCRKSKQRQAAARQAGWRQFSWCSSARHSIKSNMLSQSSFPRANVEDVKRDVLFPLKLVGKLGNDASFYSAVLVRGQTGIPYGKRQVLRVEAEHAVPDILAVVEKVRVCAVVAPVALECSLHALAVEVLHAK